MRKYVSNLLILTIKVFITIYVVLFTISIFIPPTDHIFKNYRIKYYLVSLIDNPNILYQLSKKGEEKEHYKSSIMYIDGAIGILEKNNINNKEVIKKYQTQHETLTMKLRDKENRKKYKN